MIAPLHRKVVVFAGGGTGGHLFPGVAVARAMPPGIEPVFLIPHDRGDAGRLRGEFRFETLRCPRPTDGRLAFPARFGASIGRARGILRRLGAAGVVGLGGYASAPVCVAARMLRAPLYLIELNAVPGRANRLLSRYAAGVGLASEVARERFPPRAPCRVTGTPLRGELEAAATPEEFGLAPGVPTLLVLGGSQGAQGLNSCVLAGLPACQDMDFQVLHCTGPADVGRVREGYAAAGVRSQVVDFVNDIGRAYAVADLVLSRAGASTVAECAALRRPAVFVPYPWHKDRQQVHNAWPAVRAGAAEVVEEAELKPAVLRDIVGSILLDAERRQTMSDAAGTIARPEAARAMAAHVLETFGEALVHRAAVAELGG